MRCADGEGENTHSTFRNCSLIVIITHFLSRIKEGDRENKTET